MSFRATFTCDGCGKATAAPANSYTMPDGWRIPAWSCDADALHGCSPACCIKVLRAEADRRERAEQDRRDREQRDDAARAPAAVPWPSRKEAP